MRVMVLKFWNETPQYFDCFGEKNNNIGICRTHYSVLITLYSLLLFGNPHLLILIFLKKISNNAGNRNP